MLNLRNISQTSSVKFLNIITAGLDLFELK
jgi:hypothetical protein